MITCSANTTAAEAGLDALLLGLEQATRPAAQAGAEVLYREVLSRAAVADGPSYYKGKVIQPGALRAAIYQAYSRDQSKETAGGGNTAATYHVSYNHKKAPHGWLVEYGHIQTRAVFKGADGRWHTSKTKLDSPRHVAARPFLRPAFDAVQASALRVADAELRRQMQLVISSMAWAVA